MNKLSSKRMASKGLFLKPLAFLILLCVPSLFLIKCSSDSEYSHLVEAYADSLPKEVDYNIHIRPLLSDRCFNCHGPDANKRQAGLRLDLPEPAYADLVSDGGKQAIVPGSLSKSEAFKRIISADPHLVMPTPTSNLILSKREIALIGKWIQQGAVYKPLWSLAKIENPKVPEVKNKAWVKGPSDAFLLSKMEEAGVKPSAPAERAILLRRLSFDLTGLPPSPVEVAAFEADKSPNAYEKQVDRLLASPQFGERMAMDWLDVARYADSHGYQDDGYRNAWHWRDWVIKAFNQNLPLNTFTTWQLAGDLLPKPTTDMMIATGFNRNHQQNQEGGIVPEEYRVEYVLDRVNTVGKAFLGLTVECTRCHDHKYDPLTQEDYYKMSAFFNQNDEAGQIPNFGHPGPTFSLVADSDQAKLNKLMAIVKEQEARVAQAKADFSGYNAWKSQNITDSKFTEKVLSVGLLGYYHLDKIDSIPIPYPEPEKKGKFYKRPVCINSVNNKTDAIVWKGKMVKGISGNAIEPVNEQPIVLDEIEQQHRFKPFSMGGYFKVNEFDAKGGVFFNRSSDIYQGFNGYLAHYNPDSTITFRLVHQYPASSIQITSQFKLKPGNWLHLMITYDGNSKAAGVKMYINGRLEKTRTDLDYLNKAFGLMVINRDSTPEGNVKVFGSGELSQGVFYQKMQRIKLGAMSSYQYPALRGACDEFRVYNRELGAWEIQAIAEADAGKPIPAWPWNNETLTRGIFQQMANTNLRVQLNNLFQSRYVWDTVWSNVPEVMVMRDRPVVRPTYILERGAYDAHGKQVEPGTPKILGDYPSSLPKNRLGLAKWIIDTKNPLTSRVIVNRYWQLIMGKGLVRSPGDFGNQGEMPTHPELLDYLATDFMANNWNLKRFIKNLVISNTYQQQSVLRSDLAEKDPNNLLWARMPRYRMPYEFIRDQALQNTGLLVDKIGGPSVFAIQPAGLWEEKTSGRHLERYPKVHGPDLYRRTMYSFFKRTSPPPAQTTFDGSDRYVCTVKRENTNTPLQSLVTLNHIQFQEISRVLAARLIKKQPEASPDLWISEGINLFVSRKAKASEVKVLVGLYQKALSKFAKNKEQTKAMLSAGEWPQELNEKQPEQAALATCLLTIINTDEALSRN